MSEAKRQIIEYLDSRRDDIIDFACRLVATPSANPPGDERTIANVILKQMSRLGLRDSETLARVPERPNIVCRVRGNGAGTTLLLNGHMDTKPAGGEARKRWKTDPLQPTISNGRLYGLGATDMKGGVAALVFAAGALRHVCPDRRGDLLLVISADEEAGSTHGARYLVEENLVEADIALIAEPCGLRKDFEQLCVASRGTLCFRVRVFGTQMHSSTSDMFPSVNASVKMAEVLSRMQHEMTIPHAPHPFYPRGVTRNIGVRVEGGVYYGVLPGQAEFCSDIRILPGMTPRQASGAVRDFIKQLESEDPELRVEMTEELSCPALADIAHPQVEAREPLVRMLQAAARHVLGWQVEIGGFVGGTDALYFHGLGGIPTIPAFGPGLLPLAHGPNEWVTVEAIAQASKIYALAAWDYLQ